jgi:hypothetical protein
MFWMGFVFGAAASAWFILHRNGDLLIRLSEKMREVARRYHEWEESGHV